MNSLPLPPIGTILILAHTGRPPEAVYVEDHSGDSLVLLGEPMAMGHALSRRVENYEALCRTITVRPATPADASIIDAQLGAIEKRMDTLAKDVITHAMVKRWLELAKLEYPGA